MTEPNGLAGPDFVEASCPACGFHVAMPFLDSDPQPLATLAWPDSETAAAGMPRLPLEFLRCIDCGHVYNRAFRYDEVPYSAKPNLMFNRGHAWGDFVRQLIRRLGDMLPPAAPTVVEVGHGDGGFLLRMAQSIGSGRFIGFDPNGAADGGGACEFREDLFVPEQHLVELRPDLLISRHVLEHLANPLGFLQRISGVAEILEQRVNAYFEVPCIDRAISDRRSVDFYYEHNSQFTSTSFERMLARCGAKSVDLGRGYDGEVIYGLCTFEARGQLPAIVEETNRFRSALRKGLGRVRKQLDELHRSGRRVAIWGGTGKSAAFMNRYGVDRIRFPVVVDSDPNKVGTYVPGTAQVIRSCDHLKREPPDVVVIPPQWRARDIVSEMQAEGIQCRQVLIELRGELVDLSETRYAT